MLRTWCFKHHHMTGCCASSQHQRRQYGSAPPASRPQDLPDGNYKTLMAKGDMAKPKGLPVFICAVKNYRTWVMLLTYGYCFG